MKIALDVSYAEALDGRDTHGRTLVIQVGRVLFMVYLGRAK